MQYTGTQKRLPAAAVDSHIISSSIGFAPCAFFRSSHWQPCTFNYVLVFSRGRSFTKSEVTPCLVLDHQASAPVFCAVSTKTDLIMKSKGDSNDVLESIKWFLKQNAPWWTCDVMSGGLALGLLQMKCHLWTLHFTEPPGLKKSFNVWVKQKSEWWLLTFSGSCPFIVIRGICKSFRSIWNAMHD